MTFFPSLSEDAGLAEIQAPYSDIWLLWGKFSQALMRGPGPLSTAERELIAAYVSGLNECTYCYQDHTMAAEALGIDPDVFNNLMDDIDASSVDEKMKPILRFARKLTLSPGRMLQADADAVYEAGWEEGALHFAIAVCGRYNFINRLVLGHGIEYTEAHTEIWKNEQRMAYEILPE